MRLLGPLSFSDFQILDGLVGSQVLEHSAERLPNGALRDVTQLVSNNSLNATGSALDRRKHIDENWTPFGGLPRDLFEHSYPFDGPWERFGQLCAKPGPVQPRRDHTRIGKDLVSLGAVNGLREQPDVGTENEDAVLGPRGALPLERLVLPSDTLLQLRPYRCRVLENVFRSDGRGRRLDGGRRGDARRCSGDTGLAGLGRDL